MPNGAKEWEMEMGLFNREGLWFPFIVGRVHQTIKRPFRIVGITDK